MYNPDEDPSQTGATPEHEDAGLESGSRAASELPFPDSPADNLIEIEASDAAPGDDVPCPAESILQTGSAAVPGDSAEAQPEPQEFESDTIRREGGPGCWSRGLLLVGSFFFAVVVATTLYSGGGVGDIVVITTLMLIVPLMILAFPGGLTLFFERLLAPGSETLARAEGNQTLGWLIYSLLALIGLFVRDRRWFWTVFALWVLLLLANISGCRPIFMKEIEDGFGASPPKNRNR